MGYHPSIASILQYFDYRHLPEPLRATSRRFAELAYTIADSSSGPETTVALRKLLEAKDAAVRATKDGDAATICTEVLADLRGPETA